MNVDTVVETKQEAIGPEFPALLFDVSELDCADCAAHFEEAVRKLGNVAEATLSYATAVLTVRPVGSGDGLAGAISVLGKRMGHPVSLRGDMGGTPAGTASPLEYDVGNLDCADCADSLEKAVRAVGGVASATLSFSSAVLMVQPEQESPAARLAVHRAITDVGAKMGYPVSLRGERDLPEAEEEPASWLRRLIARRRDALTLLSGLLIASAFAVGLVGAPGWASSALYALAIAVGGYFVARAGWFGFRATRSLDMNALMTLAAVGAMIIGEWAEGAMVMFLFSLGNTLEGYTVDKARNAIRTLFKLAPKVALRLDGDARNEVPVDRLVVGDRILIRADERIPMDGTIQSGHSAVNQAPVTGESIPVEKGEGDQVFAGTVNGEGSLVVLVTRLAADNTISRIIRMVEEAQASKAPSQRFVDRFARIYTPLVIAGAALVAVLPPLLGWGEFGEWFYRALVLLVISCPCALVISTPVSIVSAIATAARMGVLVKGGVHLEELGAIKVVAFDKTGTLTRGRPEVVGGYCGLHGGECTSPDSCADYGSLLGQAAAVEEHSQHPLAKAVVAQAERLGARSEGLVAENVRSEPGRGVRGTVNGHEIAIGSHAYIHANQGLDGDGALCQAAEDAAGNGQTTMVMADLCCNRRGLLTVADQIRPGAPEVIADLRAAGIEQTVMLTGDNKATAEMIAKEVGVDRVYSELSPADKVSAIQRLLAEHVRVAMVGDGVNDAPALAQATVGIAMGAIGTDAALETADIALMADDLTKLAPAIRLSRRTLGTIRQNIILALVLKGVFLALAVMGIATLWMAVFADMGTSMIVILNGMRLLRQDRQPG